MGAKKGGLYIFISNKISFSNSNKFFMTVQIFHYFLTAKTQKYEVIFSSHKIYMDTIKLHVAEFVNCLSKLTFRRSLIIVRQHKYFLLLCFCKKKLSSLDVFERFNFITQWRSVFLYFIFLYGQHPEREIFQGFCYYYSVFVALL